VTRGPLWQVSVATSGEAQEAIAELLAAWFNQPASIYQDAETGKITVSVFIRTPRRERSAGRRAALRRRIREMRGIGLDPGPGTISWRRIRREDWGESWKRHFQPIEVGRALLVRPSWSRRTPRPGQTVVVLDPGLSFGTGQHPTTLFCIEQLTPCRHRKTARSFLDIGTGSGILAISAAKLGYSPVHAFDLDPASVRVAKANAVQNGVQKRVRIVRQDLARLPLRAESKYDVVCANLTYDLLLGEFRRILNRLHPDGLLVLAGILKTQFPAVLRAYLAEGLKLVKTTLEDEWQSGAFRRR
jgi:ribosomal protein L11 methyltransferase